MFKKGIFFPVRMLSSHLSQRQLQGRFKARFITTTEEESGKKVQIVGGKKGFTE